MEEHFPTQAESINELNDPDPSVRREYIENHLYQPIDDFNLRLFCQKIEDDDKGVRDALCMLLTFCENPLVAKFVVPYISSDEISIRNLAGEILLKRGSSSIADMTKYLQNCNYDDQKFIIDLFALMNETEPAELILQILKETKNDNVAVACIEALGYLKIDFAVDDLISYYGKSYIFRPSVVVALGKIASKEGRDFLMQQYEYEDELTKFTILENLGEMGDEEIFFFLLSELRLVKPPLNWAAFLSIKKIKDQLNLDIPFDENIKNSLLNTLVEADIEYKKAVSSLITYFKDEDVFEPCLRAYGLDFEIDENLNSVLYSNLNLFFKKLNDYLQQVPSNVKSVLELLKQVLEFDNKESLYSLATLEQYSLCDSLSKLLMHTDEDVRRLSMELLFSINAETALVFTDVMQQDINMWNRMRLADLLENYPSETAENILTKLMSDPEEMVRDRANSVLAQLRVKSL